MATTIKSIRKKAAAGIERDGRFGMTIASQGNAGRGTTVRFGGVTVVAPKPAESAVRKQLAAGKRAVSQLKKVLVSPGVRLPKEPDTPAFRADPRDATLIVRELNGKKERGRFVKGEFVPLTER